MTTEETQDLQSMQSELLAVESSPWQPRCVAQAFAPGSVPFVFRMQTWIDLDAVESPFLIGELPEAESAIAHFEAAFEAFGHMGTTPELCEPDELILIGEKMIRVIQTEFSMRVRLSPPEGSTISGNRVDNGCGDWLPILACLKAQMGFSLSDALTLPVGQAFALIAAHRCNEGWSVASETYALRDVEEDVSHGG